MRNILFAFSLLTLLSCGQKNKEYQSISNPNDVRSVVIEDLQPAGDYTYVSVKDGDETYWIAVTKQELEKGETIYFKGFLEMNDFKSKELDRTFEKILFVDNISREPGELNKEAIEGDKTPVKRQSRMNVSIDSIKIEPASGGISIAQLYENAEKYKDQQVVVRGQIVKINPDIMDRNWVHIMDGTRSERSDLTFTTDQDFHSSDPE